MRDDLAGWLADDVHVFPLRVFYEDTDAAALVYYANYLKFIERARTEMMRLVGFTHSDLMAESGLAFIVRRCDIDFIAPARLDDRLEVHTRILDLRGASIEAEQIVKRDGVDLVRVGLRLGCVTREGRPARLPAGLKKALAPLQRSLSEA